jgi:hypothetical protein
VSEAERRFIAVVAHELRSEITLQRTLAEVAHADPAALREMGKRVVATCERQAPLLAALLTLARSESGRLRREPVDFAATLRMSCEPTIITDSGARQRSSRPTNRRPTAPALTRAPLPTGVGPKCLRTDALGLATVPAIANAHDATVTAQARTGSGVGIDAAFFALD